MGKLTQGCHPIAFNKGFDEEGLIDMTHPHLGLDEIGKGFKVHFGLKYFGRVSKLNTWV